MFCKRIRPTLRTLPVSSWSQVGHYILRTANLNMSEMTFVLGSRLYKLGLDNRGQLVQLCGCFKSNIFPNPCSRAHYAVICTLYPRSVDAPISYKIQVELTFNSPPAEQVQVYALTRL